MTGALAEVRGVAKRFAAGERPALDGVDLALDPGLMSGLVGPDGAGKTTLIRVLAGLVEPDAGTATLLGRRAADADRARLGYMPQRFGLYEDLSVAENLQLYADLRGLPAAERDARLHRLLEFTDLAPFTERLAGKLSGGMKQKLGLACALIRRPDVLLLDEPGVGVDPVSRGELWQMVRTLAGEGVAILWSTAYLDEAEKCDRVFLLNEGRMLAAGSPAEFLGRVAGRTFRVPVEGSARRRLLARALEAPAVLDGVVQGDSVRLLLRSAADRVPAGVLGVAGAATPAEPRFEDAFIDLLGGAGRRDGRLAREYRTIERSGVPAIEAKGLTKRFGEFTAARDIRFEVAPGEIFGLLGPNGAGKSTTFKMLCGLLTPSEGDGAVAGNDLRHARADARQSLGYMAQKFSLYGDLSVAQNLDFYSGIYGLEGPARRRAIERVTEVFALDRYLKADAGSLPLGYKQRLALACAVMHEPPVLFLDEPTSGVDPVTRREFWGHIDGLVDKGVAVLVTTHFMDEAEYCDRIAMVYRATQVATGTPDELKRRTGASSMEQAFATLMREADREHAGRGVAA